MGALACQLGIGRATLYNWVGSKDRLIAEVIWSLAEAEIARAQRDSDGSGPDYVADVVERYLEGVGSYEPVREFIARDPEYALRVLAGRRTPFQRRLIDAVRDLLQEQVEAGALDPPLDPARSLI